MGDTKISEHSKAGRYIFIYSALIYFSYVAVLILYFRRLINPPGTWLVLSTLLSGLLEVSAFYCISRLIVSTKGRLKWLFSIALLAILTLLFTLVYAAQCFALIISDSYISLLALQNTAERFLVSSHNRDILFVIILISCAMLTLLCWKAGPGKQANASSLRLIVIAGSAVIAVGVLNAHVSVAGGESELSNGQSPLASAVRLIKTSLRADETATTLPVGPTALCGVNISAGRFPFLKDTVNDHSLPFASSRNVAKPNVIVIFIEGTAARELEAYGGKYPGLTPNFSKLAADATVVDNYFNHTAATYRGLQGQFTSGFPLHGGSEDGQGWEDGNAQIYGRRSYSLLPSIFDQRGYDTVFFSPHKHGRAFHSFLKTLGFKDLYSYDRSVAELLPRPEPPFADALDDHDSFQALTHFLEARKTDKPFFIGMYTVGTHAFLDAPSGADRYGSGDNSTLDTIHYTDEQLGLFYKYFMSSKYAQDTLLIITSDHAHYPEPPYVAIAGRDFRPFFVDRIPLFIHAPWLKLPARYDARGRTSLDLAPTILQMLNINDVENAFLGRSIFDQAHDLPISFAALGHAVFAIYHGVVYDSVAMPSSITAQYKQCRLLVETYYAHEMSNTLYPDGTGNSSNASAGEKRDIAQALAAPSTQELIVPVLFNKKDDWKRGRLSTSCAVDMVNGQAGGPDGLIQADGNSPIEISGWITNTSREAVPRLTIVLRGEKAYGFNAGVHVDRPDVATALRSPAATHSGFSAQMDLGDLPNGTYAISTLIHSGIGTEYCQSGKSIALEH